MILRQAQRALLPLAALLLGCEEPTANPPDSTPPHDIAVVADGGAPPDVRPDAWFPDLSSAPTLTRLFFSSNRSGTYQIWSADPLLTAPVQLTTDPDHNAWWPRVSPSGDLVYFYRSARDVQKTETNDYDNASLWRMKRDGSAQTLVLPTEEWCSQGVIDFRADGGKIVMAGRKRTAGSCDGWQLYTAGTDLSQLTKLSRTSSLYLDPSWSFDGSQITFISLPRSMTVQEILAAIVAGTVERYYEVFVMDADGSNEVQLTHDQLRDNDPYFSPDGSYIVFESAVDSTHAGGLGRWALRLIAPTGGQAPTMLLNDGNINTLARWTLDGARLYFHRLTYNPISGLPSRGWHLARIESDGSGLQSVTPAGISGDVDVDLVYGSPP